MAHMIAEFLAAFIPPRMASAPPVKKPAMTRKERQRPSLQAHIMWKIRVHKHTGIVRVLLLSDSLDGAVERREHTTPDTKVSAQHRGTSLNRGDRTYPSFTVRAVSESLNTVPDSASNSLKQENNPSALNVRSSRNTPGGFDGAG